MAQDCIFCKIVEGHIPSQKIFENESVLGFKDIQPHAPVHYVFIPKKHVESLATLTNENRKELDEVLWALISVAQKEGWAEKGFRTVINTNKWGGQTVSHLHAHLLSGKQLGGGMVGNH